MKPILLLLTILISQLSFGKQPFPNVEYSYVKVFLFNLETNFKERPDSYIYKDAVFAKTKAGEGVVLDKKKVNSLNKMLSGDVNTLLIGLSKCFIPRHGFVYYNDKDEPVASVSVCFECEAIRLWSKNDLRIKTDYDKMSVSKAEKQILFIKDNILDGVLPVFKETHKYKDFIASQKNIENKGEMTITREDTLKSFVNKLKANNIKTWKSNKGLFVEGYDVEITAGGDKYKFKTFVFEEESKFLFYDNSENPLLAEAEIVSPYIILPNGISVGTSLDEVISNIGLYDGISNPKIIYLESIGLKIAYHFKNNTLVKINLYVYQ